MPVFVKSEKQKLFTGPKCNLSGQFWMNAQYAKWKFQMEWIHWIATYVRNGPKGHALDIQQQCITIRH